MDIPAHAYSRTIGELQPFMHGVTIIISASVSISSPRSALTDPRKWVNKCTGFLEVIGLYLSCGNPCRAWNHASTGYPSVYSSPNTEQNMMRIIGQPSSRRPRLRGIHSGPYAAWCSYGPYPDALPHTTRILSDSVEQATPYCPASTPLKSLFTLHRLKDPRAARDRHFALNADPFEILFLLVFW